MEPQAERDLERLNRADRTHRFRIGEYRATFELHGRTIYVTRILHRREAYR